MCPKKTPKEETKTKSLRPKLLKTLYSINEKIRIWEMGKNFSPWTKFDPLTTNIFWIYNLSSLDIINFVAYHKS